jgi:hypothetical protein
MSKSHFEPKPAPFLDTPPIGDPTFDPSPSPQHDHTEGTMRQMRGGPDPGQIAAAPVPVAPDPRLLGMMGEMLTILEVAVSHIPMAHGLVGRVAAARVAYNALLPVE